jgi:hypothetical protein
MKRDGERVCQNAMIHFQMDGESYGFVMPAESLEDAERRMRAIRLTGIVAGWPCYSYRANALTLPLVAIWVHLTTAVRNLLRVRP